MPSTLVLIAAVARNGVIGRNGGLVFEDPVDQRHFRAATLGCPVIMGRRTWESLPQRFRPLPGRRNLVVTRDIAWQAHGAERAASLAAARAATADAGRVFVIGGAQLYAEALPLADELLLTEVDADLDGDTRFPSWNRGQFDVLSRQQYTSAQGLPFTITTYRRRPG